MQFKLMTFNIQGELKNGPYAWDRRAGLVLETVKRQSPELLGFQELQRMNLEVLQPGLATYFYELGPLAGSPPTTYNAIFWRNDAFEKIESGGFWLSETPDVPSSSDWNSSEPRVVNWVRLRSRQDDLEMLYLNTHFDHLSPRARVQSAELITRKLEEIRGGGLPVVLAGDFNCNAYYPPELGQPGEASDPRPYEVLIEHGFVDAYLASGQVDSRQSNTFENYEGPSYHPSHNFPFTPWRIDWILLSSGEHKLNPVAAEIDHFHEGERYPSDHYPVVAKIESGETRIE